MLLHFLCDSQCRCVVQSRVLAAWLFSSTRNDRWDSWLRVVEIYLACGLRAIIALYHRRKPFLLQDLLQDLFSAFTAADVFLVDGFGHSIIKV